MKTYSSEGCMEAMLRDAVTAEHENYIDNGTIQQQHEEIEKLRAALESIAGWRRVNISGEYEHGLRDIIRSITDCAAAALDTVSFSACDGKSIENTGTDQ